jgi:hypothetical protein
MILLYLLLYTLDSVSYRYGGSVGAAVFGIGGIQPFPGASGRRVIAPVPWLVDAPRGSAVWQSRAGAIAAVSAMC